MSDRISEEAMVRRIRRAALSTMAEAAKILGGAADYWRGINEEANAATCENEAGRVREAIRLAADKDHSPRGEGEKHD